MQERHMTVAQLTKYLKHKIETDKHLQTIYLKGEVSNFKRHHTGHLYFVLKDEEAQVSSMMFNNLASKLLFSPKDGDKVLVKATINLYVPRGTYSLNIYEMTLDGIGDLYLQYEALKKDFQDKGYFDQVHKKPIPKYPKRIGVITSNTGAVIEDIKNTVTRRYLLTEILLYPALVQGQGAKESIVTQINKANEQALVDVLIVGRGGGSIEDLWAFNEKEVVEAIFHSKIPIITAIGHETDFTLSDFVSDLRAPTPTAAAELATPNMLDLVDKIKENRRLLDYHIKAKFDYLNQTLVYLEERLTSLSPQKRIEQYYKDLEKQKLLLQKNYETQILTNRFRLTTINQRLISPKDKIDAFLVKLEFLEKMMHQKYTQQLQDKTLKLITQNEKLKGLDPLVYMNKGFSLVTKDNKVLTSIKMIDVKDQLTIQLTDGLVQAVVTEKREK